MPKREDLVDLHVRLPKDLHAQIREVAQEEERSVNSAVVWLLRRVLMLTPKPAQAEPRRPAAPEGD